MFKNIMARWGKYQNEVRTIRELNSLNARELNDIGIVRSDIIAIAKGKKFDI